MGNAIIVEPYNLQVVVAEGSSGGTEPGNLNNDWIGVVHRGTAVAPPALVSADFGGALPVDTVALLNSTGTATQWEVNGGTVSGASNVYLASGLTFAAGATGTTSGKVHSLHLLPAIYMARYWTARFTAMAGVFEAGRYVLGRKYQPARNFSFGAAFGVQDLGGGKFNSQGVWLPQPGIIQRTIGLSFTSTTRQEAELTLQPLLERVGNSKHILLVTNPDPDTLLQKRMYFGPLQGNLDTLWRVPDGWEWRANLVSTI
jgi:hypothetical protein